MKNRVAIFILSAAVVSFGCASIDIEEEWAHTTSNGKVYAYRSFLWKYPNSKYSAEANTRIEEIEWEKTRSLDTSRYENTTKVDAFRLFLREHPNSQYSNQALVRIGALHQEAWEQTRDEDKAYRYEEFILHYPESEFTPRARERLEWQRANRAVVEVEYPKEVRRGNGWNWGTVFRETGGKAGITLVRRSCPQLCDEYIAVRGGRWYHGGTGNTQVNLTANGTDSILDRWVVINKGSDKSSMEVEDSWVGGYYHAFWGGEDDFGNRTSIEISIHLIE